MTTDFITHCDKCGKEIKVAKKIQDGKFFYMIHGLFCINIPGFFCEKECFEDTVKKMKGFDYLDRDDEGKPVVDVDVMINESLILDKMYDIVYEVDNPLFPTLVFQRLLEVDPENVRFLHALSSLYVGLLAAEKVPADFKTKVTERLEETAGELERLSPAGYKVIKQLRDHYNV